MQCIPYLCASEKQANNDVAEEREPDSVSSMEEPVSEGGERGSPHKCDASHGVKVLSWSGVEEADLFEVGE